MSHHFNPFVRQGVGESRYAGKITNEVLNVYSFSTALVIDSDHIKFKKLSGFNNYRRQPSRIEDVFYQVLRLLSLRTESTIHSSWRLHSWTSR